MSFKYLGPMTWRWRLHFWWQRQLERLYVRIYGKSEG